MCCMTGNQQACLQAALLYLLLTQVMYAGALHRTKAKEGNQGC